MLRWGGQVVSAAHSVVLASGTLAPMEALSQQLFPGPAAAARVRHFSCGHVVSKDRLLALAIGAPPAKSLLHSEHLCTCHSTCAQGNAEKGHLLHIYKTFGGFTLTCRWSGRMQFTICP